MSRTLFTVALAVAAAPSAFGQQFQRDNSFPAQSLWTDGVEIVDVDGDGDQDILFANGSAYGSTGTGGALDQHLFLNNGSGSFTAAHGQLDHGGNFNAKQVVAEDFDNDGDPDLIYCSGSAGHAPRLLLNDGAGNFSNNSGNLPTFSPGLRSFGVAAGDIDDDGDLDVAISDGGTFGGFASQLRLLENNGSAVFTEVTNTQLPVDLYNCQDIIFVDFDGDFDVDIALTGKGGAGKRGRLYVNDGSGNFSIDSAMDGVGTGSTYEGDWSDLDGDGDFDISTQSIQSVNEGWARNDGNNVAMAEFTYPSPNGGDDNEMAQCDYNNDGNMDCFAGSLSNAGEKVWRNNGGSSFTNANSIIQTITDSTLDMGFGDLDGDGDYDFVTGQGESGNFTNKIYINGGGADSVAPSVLGSESPATFNVGGSNVLHAIIQDSFADDGHISAGMSATWTSDAGSGSAVVTHMGNGLFRAAFNAPGGATFVDFDWTATDFNGNSTTIPTISMTPGVVVWADLGNGTAGTGGLVPVLTGTGPLTSGSVNQVDLSSALPSSTTNVFIGFTLINVLFKGGILGPSPDVLVLGLPVSGSGTNSIPFVWPAGVPNGTPFWVQHWVADGAGPAGFSASNTLQGTAQ